MKTFAAAALLIAGLSPNLSADPVRSDLSVLDAIPAYQPVAQVDGLIRNCGNDEMKKLAGLWEEGFQAFQPNARFDDGQLISSAVGAGGIALKVADLALMGREMWGIEIMGVFRGTGGEPLEIKVATGAFDKSDKTWAVGIFVHKDNPLSKLTLKQIDGIFGAARTGGWTGVVWHPEVARSAQDDIRTWGQLGLTGEWADQPIQIYGYDLQMSGTRFTLERIAFKGGDKWNPALREYVGSDRLADPALRLRGGEQMLPDLVRNKYGIAYTGAQYTRKYPLKAVAVAVDESSPYVAPSTETCRDRTYPLVRDIYVYIPRAAGKPIDPKAKEFVRYILSRQGQAAVVADGGYLPLPAQTVAEELKKLEYSAAGSVPAADGQNSWTKSADNKIYAQLLVNQIMAGDGQLITAGIHAIPPGKKAQVIVASTLDRIGKEDDEGDIAVGQKGATMLTPNLSSPSRLGIMLPLKTATGERIGALALQFKYQAGDDEANLYLKSVAIRDKIAARIGSPADLFKSSL